MLQPINLKEISETATGIGPYKRYILPEDKNGNLLPPTTLIQDAHAVGLKVHPYTFRKEPKYLNKAYGNDPEKEYLQFFELGVDGVFSDFSDLAVAAKKTFLKSGKSKASGR
jgi:glycerophosphoryl diester phosphodiesterase